MNTDRRSDAIRGLAWACATLMLVVTTASAWLRLGQPRVACSDWPACREVVRAHAQATAPALLGQGTALAAVRGVHRIAASLALLAALALGVATLARPPRRPVAGAHALALLGLALGLAALGIVTPGSRAAGVLLGNLLGGLLMLALAWRLARHLGDAPAVGKPLARWALAGAVLWAAQAALGAASGAGLGSAAPVAHIALAQVAGPLALGVGWAARRAGRRTEGAALMALALLQFALGAAVAVSGAAGGLVLVHNVGAAVGLALLVGLGAGPAR